MTPHEAQGQLKHHEEFEDAVCALVDSYQWLAEGRGPYRYDDAGYDDDVRRFTQGLVDLLPGGRYEPATSTFSRLQGRLAAYGRAVEEALADDAVTWPDGVWRVKAILTRVLTPDAGGGER